jgi:hypothetical protein
MPCCSGVGVPVPQDEEIKSGLLIRVQSAKLYPAPEHHGRSLSPVLVMFATIAKGLQREIFRDDLFAGGTILFMTDEDIDRKRGFIPISLIDAEEGDAGLADIDNFTQLFILRLLQQGIGIAANPIPGAAPLFR